ncbi:hypothetical protein BGX31_005013, partial [Mortierella sp. GBA43]
RLLDQIVTRFENMDQIKLIFLQVIGQTCVFYTMMRADAVCVAVEFARLKIAIPAFPLIYKSMLKDSGAVFAGWTQDEMYGQLETWNFFYSGVPVSVFTDKQKRFVRYDFWTPQDRTFTTTRFFNIKTGHQKNSLFNLAC